jgi:hypothetical protein
MRLDRTRRGSWRNLAIFCAANTIIAHADRRTHVSGRFSEAIISAGFVAGLKKGCRDQGVMRGEVKLLFEVSPANFPQVMRDRIMVI